MTQGDEALDLLRRVGAMLEGHFQYTSGRHGALYVEKFRLLEDPAATVDICTQLAAPARAHDVELVVGPTTGGVIIAYELARQLGTHAFFAERVGETDARSLQRGFQVRPGQRTLIVDDVLTTGGSVRQTIAAVEQAGGLPVAVAVLIDRSGGRTDFGLPFEAAMTLDIETHPADDCPLCRDGVPLIET
jgi:orotate phosphoribosyltransferase